MALLNVSAMSFGSLSANAVLALNAGAAAGHFAHDTGEGGLSEYHLRPGGDLVWEIGTGYFGCRTEDGGFDAAKFADKAAHDHVKCVSLKLSQGAKPGIGGVLPGPKVNAEIAQVRGVPQGRTVISPPYHRVFSTPRELVRFVARMRDLSGGKPTGFKLCLGSRRQFLAVCKAMLEEGTAPDFIIVDGAEGAPGQRRWSSPTMSVPRSPMVCSPCTTPSSAPASEIASRSEPAARSPRAPTWSNASSRAPTTATRRAR